MKKKLYPALILFVFFFTACKTVPVDSALPADPVTPIKPGVETPTESTVKPIAAPTAPETVSDEDTVVVQFDTITITKQTFKNTKSEIQLVVEDLNKITFSKNFESWQNYLTDEYRKNFSDLAILEKVSASLPVKNVQLRTLKDYFTYVFVPSRQNMRVDDIQFVSPTRVYVIMEIAPKSPAAIYILEKTSGKWKLVLKNQ